MSAPTNVPMKSSRRLPVGSGSGRLKAAGLRTIATAIRTAARPTSECIAATSSGICVISTRRATSAPIDPPIRIASRIRSIRLVIASVVPTAMSIPTMPNQFPRRADSGFDSPFSARMKRTLATRYQRAT